jgi:probable HAF family extracellular repeat protein
LLVIARRWIEPQGSAASLPRVPDRHDLSCHAGHYTTLNDPLGAFGTVATGINDEGQIVGYYEDSNGHFHGFLYSRGVFTALDDPSATAGTFAEGINNIGQSVGYYEDSSGPHGFLANAVPELSTWAMMLIGFAGVGFAAYRRSLGFTRSPR